MNRVTAYAEIDSVPEDVSLTIAKEKFANRLNPEHFDDIEEPSLECESSADERMNFTMELSKKTAQLSSVKRELRERTEEVAALKAELAERNRAFAALQDELDSSNAELLEHSCLKQEILRLKDEISEWESAAPGPESGNLLRQLLPQCDVAKLVLDHQKLGESGAQALADALPHCGSLMKLSLYDCDLGVGGARAIACSLPSCESLEILVLGKNNMGDVGVGVLSRSFRPTLKHLALFGNKIGDLGACSLAEALTECVDLEFLNLGENSIGDVGADALAQALVAMPALTYFDLEDNQVSSEGERAVIDAWESCGKPAEKTTGPISEWTGLFI